MYLAFCAIVLLGINNVAPDKITTESLDSYNAFFNYGDKKNLKLEKENLENAVIKSKVEVLGEVFKKHIDSLKVWQKLDIVFLIDASSSVGEQNFKSELKFVKKLLSDVVVDYDHSRISIVTFSSKNSVVTNVDEISLPNKQNNKCLLLNKELNSIKYLGGGTYTLGAFKIAKDIFKHSRNDTKKLLFLITDGYSNGGDPVPLANDLKKQYVTIFTIGIKNGNYKELYQLSSSPGEFFSYLLDSFEEFESLARRALHVDVKDGDYLPLGTNGPCHKLCDRGNCCDKNAVCTCGTSTGHYTCLCNPGYYGSGLRNSCFSCPSGTYADAPNVCFPCPDIHHTTEVPAIGILSCKCKSGYRASKDYKCETIKCLKLSPPKNGYFVRRKECGNVLNNACGVRCEVGFSLIGSSIRLCQMNGTWSGDAPSCQVKTCKSLPTPAHGSISCAHADLGTKYKNSEPDMPVDTVCSFSCNKGYSLIGSAHRTCLPLAQWDGLKVSCKQIKCNKLSNIPFGIIEPEICTSSKQSFGKKCVYKCKNGFKLKGPTERVCSGRHGVWSNKSNQSVCEDVTPPSLVCPPNIQGVTNADRNYGTVFWMEPNVTDNSGLNVTVWLKPAIANITEFRFKIGQTKVTYFAQDAFQNQAKCSFTVDIKDSQSPTIEDCIDPVPFLSLTTSGTNITWEEPSIYDNSDFVMISRSHDFGYFEVGTTPVTYTAKDASGNINICTMNITVVESQCEPLPDPIFGHSECTSKEEGIQCIVTCQEGYAIPMSSTIDTIDTTDSQFICDHADPVWYSKKNSFFPDCSITQVPVEVLQNGVITVQSQLDEDLCNNTTALKEIENEIKINLNANLQKTCAVSHSCNLTTNTICENPEDSVYEEKTNIIKREISKRKTRRSSRINIEFSIHARVTEKDNVSTIAALANLKNFEMKSNRTKIVSVRLDKTNAVCPVGYVQKKLRCVQCPKGTFHNATTKVCQSCPLGFYNDKPGQGSCTICPTNYSTSKMHSKSVKDCKAHCPPGTHGRRRKLKPSRQNSNTTLDHITLVPHCRTCRIGYYQSNYGQLSCRSCPEGHTTLSRKSTNLNQCLPTTTQLCNNSTNVCNKGKCVVEDSFYYSCSCDANYIGSHCETQINSCSSNPCLNRGVCVPNSEDTSDYSCKCREGYTGQICEEIEDKCDKVCQNGGKCARTDDDEEEVCVCEEGFGGECCEQKVKYCDTRICEHGACTEIANGYQCLCEDGFIGKRCNILPCDYTPCPENSLCVNINDVNATQKSYRCECPKNYKGKSCTEEIDFCASNPCLNNATCMNTDDQYKCICPKTFYGINCQLKMNSDYILRFPRSGTTDFVKLNEFDQNLTQISACLWMMTKDNFNYGTLLSYATFEHDNAFTLTDYTGLVLYVNGEHIITDIYLNDGIWHFLCVTWDNLIGVYNIYVDGKNVENGDGLSNNTVIKGNGKMIIGQEQDVLGGRFSQTESFLGEIAYLDVWSRILNESEIVYNMMNCEESVFGDVYAWPEIRNFIHGEVEVLSSTFCQNCTSPSVLENGFVEVIGIAAYYKCDLGYELTTQIYNSGRVCTKASSWIGNVEPKCTRVYCGYPGYVAHGEIIGRSYFYGDKIKYNCKNNYKLTGNDERLCLANGSWSSTEPSCVGMRCNGFSIPNHGEVTIATDSSEEAFENSKEFEAGVEIEITCNDNYELNGSRYLKCRSNGTWSDTIPHCKVISKPPHLACSIEQLPQPPVNGYTIIESLNSYTSGKTNFVEFKCRQGYMPQKISSATCILDGYWTEIDLSCNVVTCDNPPKFNKMQIKHKILINTKYHYGNMVTYECMDGYRMFGNGAIRCLSNGRWTRLQGKCTRKSCFKPTVKESTIIEGNSYLYGDQVNVTCKANSKHVLTCSSSGKWEGTLDDYC
ncbi:hypothetical protein RN001_003939 [Aquatica leii]|uniref:Sushi, von Willebrand factor type A, EGF and pentraxin domain-containing protein 1 n=1 Tax=Aquatica leii TaxID=1421715 RepID=A0AAN7SRR9_9COLE|nr:hypothetical protein RN001_003939 [Aquatica leii]